MRKEAESLCRRGWSGKNAYKVWLVANSVPCRVLALFFNRLGLSLMPDTRGAPVQAPERATILYSTEMLEPGPLEEDEDP